MKPIEEVVACVWDYGSFLSLAEKLAETCAKVFYYSPYEQEFRDVKRCCIGDGLPKVIRCDDPLHPDYLDQINLCVFPDIGYGGTQMHLKRLGKAVWGSMGASDLELYRTRFLKVIQETGLPVVPWVKCVGLTKLNEHLKKVEDKWVKVNRFRENMETWHHIDYAHSLDELQRLAIEFGGVGEHVIFVVQDTIDTDIEIGYDGWTIDGEFPESCYQGYEKKNELYLGSQRKYSQLPEQVRYVNEKMAPTLREYGYRNWFATELRVLDGIPHFIDPTMRMPGQTGEHQLENCENLAEVIWAGAHGEIIQPQWLSPFACEATMHFKGPDQWRTLSIPEEVRRWVKLYSFCMVDGLYKFPPRKNDELGVVLGLGKTVEDAKAHLDHNMELLKKEPLSIESRGFADLLEAIEEAEEEGLIFSDEALPEPQSVL